MKTNRIAEAIKIADNEEMTGAFEIKLKEGNRIKAVRRAIEKPEEEIFSLRIPSEANASVRIGDDYLVSGLGYFTAAGVLMLDELTPNARFVIMAELINAQP